MMKIFLTITELADSIKEDAPIYTFGLTAIFLIAIVFLSILDGNLFFLLLVFLILLLLINLLYFWAVCHHNNRFLATVIVGSFGLYFVGEWVTVFSGFFILPLILVSFFD